jgi:hypothetical protein
MAASLNDSATLGAHAPFMARVQSGLVSACVAIANEGTNVVNHVPRIQLVHQVLANPTTLTAWSNIIALSVANDASVIADATQAGTVILAAGNIAAQAALVTDAHITNAISAMFNAFCPGIVA